MVTKKTNRKAAKKKAKAPKKAAVAQIKAKTALPSAEFVADLTEVFTRHGWSGLPKQLSFSLAGGCDRKCDDGSIAQPKWIDCPGGIRKMVCVCPGEDPSCQD